VLSVGAAELSCLSVARPTKLFCQKKKKKKTNACNDPKSETVVELGKPRLMVASER